jgi:hypothetical protein
MLLFVVFQSTRMLYRYFQIEGANCIQLGHGIFSDWKEMEGCQNCQFGAKRSSEKMS